MTQTLAPLRALFILGATEFLFSRPRIISRCIMYGVLLAVFHSIYSIMPLGDLNVPHITRHHLLWYFAITEIVVVSSSNASRLLGDAITEGEILTLLQRPLGILPAIMAQGLGSFVAQASVLSLFACLFLPLLFKTPFVLAGMHLPLLIVSVMLGGLISLCLWFLCGTLEILGPYSRPARWIIGKLMFSLGGLFFPVAFFPEALKPYLMATPFPSILSWPASFMLNPHETAWVSLLVQQMGWLCLVVFLAWRVEKKLVHRVLIQGE